MNPALMRTTDNREPALYLDLLKHCLIGSIYEDAPIPNFIAGETAAVYCRSKRLRGEDWPSLAHTMIGLKRLENIQMLVQQILADGIEGDVIEAGVWRGGAAIFMRGVLKAYDVRDRNVWVADSFNGFPPAESVSEQSYQSVALRTAVEALDHNPKAFANYREQLMNGTSYDEVRNNFEKYNLFDEQVRFLPGWFRDTLPAAPIKKLALLRVDCDLYDSTMDVLQSLYPKLSPGGFTIIDDYYAFEECQKAVNDYVCSVNAEVTVQRTEDDLVFWRK